MIESDREFSLNRCQRMSKSQSGITSHPLQTLASANKRSRLILAVFQRCLCLEIQKDNPDYLRSLGSSRLYFHTTLSQIAAALQHRGLQIACKFAQFAIKIVYRKRMIWCTTKAEAIANDISNTRCPTTRAGGLCSPYSH